MIRDIFLKENINKYIDVNYFIDDVMKSGHIFPINSFTFKLKLNEDCFEDASERKEAYEIRKKLILYLKSILPQNEIDMINTYLTYPLHANILYNQYNQKESELNNILKDKKITINSKIYGDIIFKFIKHIDTDKYIFTRFAHNDENDEIYIYIPKDKITMSDLASLFDNNKRLVHEIVHLIDNKNNRLTSDNYNELNRKAYFNHPNEFKAFSQDLICEFGRYIFKNNVNINKNKLNNEDYVFNILADFLEENGSEYKMKKHTIDLFVEFINSLTEQNGKVFLNMLKEYLQYICNTDKDIDLSESFTKNQLINLFRGEKYFKEAK